jgi:hypothetical protein
VNGKRLGGLVLAGSLGLNLALAGILVYSQVIRPAPSPSRTYPGRMYSSGRGPGSGPGQGNQPSGRDSERNYPRIDPQQVARMRGMRETMQEEISPLWERVHSNQILIQEELLAEKPDLVRLDSLSIENTGLQQQIQLRTLRLILEERDILTKEQYEHFLRWMLPAPERSRAEPMRPGQPNRREGMPDSTRTSNRRGGPPSTPPPYRYR